VGGNPNSHTTSCSCCFSSNRAPPCL
jgi:hypothetical protein